MMTSQTKQWTRRVGAVVAAVVMTVAFTACGGGGDDGGDKAYVEPKGPSTETLSFVAKNFSFTPENASADAGIATIKLTADQGIHDFVFDGAYPGFQLDPEGRPRPVVADVLSHLSQLDTTPWQQALWFMAANGWLDGRRPVDLLDDQPGAVVSAAEAAVREPVG